MKVKKLYTENCWHINEKSCVCVSHSVVFDSLWPHGL